MKTVKILMVIVLLVSLATTATAAGPGGSGGGSGGGKPIGGGATETASNNLSYPVIWSEGVPKTLTGTPEMVPVLGGVWWYQWGTNGTDPNVVPASCPPDADETNIVLNPDKRPYCNDNIPGSLTKEAGVPPADSPLPIVRAHLQKDRYNVWQAWHGVATLAGVANMAGGVDIDWIDWGDNLESVDWYTRSQVRTEVVLFKDLPTPLREYEMRHTSGWGIDEVHGLAASLEKVPQLGPGTRATVYSNCARLTIQKLLVPRDDARLLDLVWVPGEGWTEPEGYATDLINPHIFNGSVHEGGDGPGYYSAEINVKGRVIYGYTWNVRNLHDDTPAIGSSIPTPAGDYRITFSFDQVCGTVNLATYFVEGTTQIMLPLETEEATEVVPTGEDDSAGAEGVLIPAQYDVGGAFVGGNLTYMDVRILDRGGSGGGSGKTSRPSTDEAVGCDCNCECVGEKCTCTCKEECDCVCDCQGDSCPCQCEAPDCALCRTQMRAMEQLRTQLHAQCPGADCPCTDHQGDACLQYQAQLTNMLQAMERLQFRTYCDGVTCSCVCQSGDLCLQLQTQLGTMLQTQDQLRTQCTAGDCDADAEYLTKMSAAMTELYELLGTMEQDHQVYFPSVPMPK